MRIAVLGIILGGIFFGAPLAQAQYFGGGNGDGYGYALGDSRSWGFFGGQGRGETTLMTGTQTIMTFTSAASQTFTIHDPSTVASALTIGQVLTVGTGVVTANGLRVIIPSDLSMTWDTTKTSITVTGSAAGKVSASAPALTVSYPNSQTMLIPVITNFVDGDVIYLSGMQFNNFTAASLDSLRLDITGSGTIYDVDPYPKMIIAPAG